MANYQAIIRSNYFTVKDETRFREMVQRVVADEEVELFEQPQPDGSFKFALGSYGSIGLPESDGDDSNITFDCLLGALQELVCEDDAVIITEIGYEKLRYVVGSTTVITSEGFDYITLPDAALDVARKRLGDQNFKTQLDY